MSSIGKKVYNEKLDAIASDHNTVTVNNAPLKTQSRKQPHDLLPDTCTKYTFGLNFWLKKTTLVIIQCIIKVL